MIKKTSTIIFSLLVSIVPASAFALSFSAGINVGSNSSQNNLSSLIDTIIGYANQILVLMMGIAVVMFVYYIIKYFIKADANRVDGGKYVLYSVVGFFVILSFWGIVNILQNTFGLQNDANSPAGWQSFTNIFPGGSSGGSTIQNQGPAGCPPGEYPVGMGECAPM
ncbi:MAG: hypothetical protein AAB470_03115 [Patescibacteria group bacterium]